MGKQIINILPEGSAVLNPDHTPYCLPAKSKQGVQLPLYFNSTLPAQIELSRIDLDTGKEEIHRVSPRDINKIVKAIRDHPSGISAPYSFAATKPGIYRLHKVLDEYKLEVQRRTKATYVVPCPLAKIKTADSSTRCIRDLSNLSLDVTGTPPLKIMYSQTVNGKNEKKFHIQSLQPDGFASPLIGSGGATAELPADDVSWVRPATVTVGLNESMTSAGTWQYSVDEVHDAFGNVVRYTKGDDDTDGTSMGELAHTFEVRQRPNVRMNGCDLRTALKVAKGKAVTLPVHFSSSSESAYHVEWDFSPIDSLTNSGDHGDKVSVGAFTAKKASDKPEVSAPGLYTLKSVTSGSCEGEVDEPSSCLLLNPLEPHLSVRAEEIPDKCAGNSIGLLVDLDLVGTPPFTIRYNVKTQHGVDEVVHKTPSLRSKLELIPIAPGAHTYEFKSISDNVYSNIPVTGDDKVFSQDVRPAANAYIAQAQQSISACLDSTIDVDVAFAGDPPFSLEWEMVYDGKRKMEKITGLESNRHTITTPPLTKGGDYILGLSSVQDKRGCRNPLQDQMKIAVRRQRPRGQFGLMEQKNSIMAVKDAELKLPLRLQGEGPWSVSYKNLDDESGNLITETVSSANGFLTVKKRGVYELVDVRDDKCPGTVEASSSTFKVDWYAQPEMSLVATDGVKKDKDTYIKPEICEGDIDGFELLMQGSPPYHVKYNVHHDGPKGANAPKGVKKHQFDAALSKASISMDTTKPGEYTYEFYALEDTLYKLDKSFSPVKVKQRVNAKPSAAFAKPGLAFKFCAEEQEQEDKIPITLTGVAPFYVEVEIKHQSGSAPETYHVPSISTDSYNMQIPRKHLRLGSQQLRIRRVRDARGCQQKYELNGPSVHIQLYDAPSIYPLESREDYCVGERIAYTLSGTPPFDISYEFNGKWNAKSQTTSFRRVAEKPGNFIINSISDKASECRAAVNVKKTIHPLPSVQISRGKQERVDIHEGNEVDILFEFWGTPPFEFTYTRSTNAQKGQKSTILETRHDVSHEHSKIIKASQEGTYEVVAIKDKFCSFSTQQTDKRERK